MKVFLYEDHNHLESLFLKPEYEIPFLGTSLLDFSKKSFQELAQEIDENLEYFVPESWFVDEKKYSYNILDYLSEEPELVFLTNVYSLFFGFFDKEYIHHLKQNKGKAFSNNGTVASYLSKNDGLSEPSDDETLNSFFYVNEKNYLRVTQKLLGQVEGERKRVDSRVFGDPVILSDNVFNSTVCGPSYIGENVSVVNSYVGPGTVILGTSSIQNSKVFSSFLDESSIRNVETEDSLIIHSFIENVNLKDSVSPSGGIITYER